MPKIDKNIFIVYTPIADNRLVPVSSAYPHRQFPHRKVGRTVAESQTNPDVYVCHFFLRNFWII